MDVPVTTSAIPPVAPSGGIAPQNQGRRALANAIAAINQSGLWPGRGLRIHMDLSSQRLTVQVVNSETDEIIDQIPSEEVLRMAVELGGNASAPPGQGKTTP
jgi:flagellar protein FlaG